MENRYTADRLRSYLESKQMKAADLARLSGVSKPQISKYLKGEYGPTKETAEKIARVLGITADELLGFDEYTEGQEPVTPDEFRNIILKYRALDTRGKDIVETILARETILTRKAELHLQTELKAAHERTDIAVTDDMRKHDDEIMEGDNF